MLSRTLRRLAVPLVAKRAASEVAVEGGAAYDVVLIAAWTGLLYNHYARNLDGSAICGVPVLFPFRQASTDFEYGGIKKINNLFGQFQLPPPFSS